MQCRKCENNIKSDFKYCPYCGERIISDFHDHFEELTPPFVIRDAQETDEAVRIYAASPEERFPDFYDGPFSAAGEQTQETPYFVYHPEPDRHAPERRQTAEPVFAHAQEAAGPAEKEKKRGTVGLGFKFFLILLVLLLAAVLSIFGYRFFATPEPFQNFDLSAMFASVYLE